MASYHFHNSSIQRSKGQNAVAKAAYISASKLVYKTIDKEIGEEISITYDFTKKQGVVYSKIFVPEGFEDVAWLQDREQLWNAVEAREKREDSITGVEIEFSLPKEVSKEQNIKLVEAYVHKNIVSRGIVCDVNIHYDNPENPHLHIQYLSRNLKRLENQEVVFDKKDRELTSSNKFLVSLRHQCEVEINKVYEETGLHFRVTAKSFKTLGIEQEATRHKGPAHYMKATELEAKNKEIIAENAKKIYEHPEIVFGRISYTKPVFTKEDIAIALSDALMVHLVSKGSDIAREQEAIREFSKGLVQEQVGGENVAQNIANDAIATTAGTQEKIQIATKQTIRFITHLLNMLNNAVYSKKIPFQTVLFDTWYSTHKIMQHVDSLGKYYYAPIKANRNVSKTHDSKPYKAVKELTFSDEEIRHGVEIHIKGFAKNKHVNLFKFTVSTNRVEYVVTNNKTQKSSKAAQDECGFRWVIESMHREIKQLTGIERCQCRKQRIQRNHISCAFLVWAFLKRTANTIGKTVYQIKLGLLDDYMQQQLRSPSLRYLEPNIA